MSAYHAAERALPRVPHRVPRVVPGQSIAADGMARSWEQRS
jgi:hypothetical protein